MRVGQLAERTMSGNGTKRQSAVGGPPPPCWPHSRCQASSRMSLAGVALQVRHRSPSRSPGRSEEHTSELQSLMRISYAVFCLKKKNNIQHTLKTSTTIINNPHKTK